MPYILSQICSGMRRVVLTTPFIWASMLIHTSRIYTTRPESHPEIYAIFAQKAIEWFERAGGIGLTVIVEDVRALFDSNGTESDPANILFNVLLSYSGSLEESSIHFILSGPSYTHESHCVIDKLPMCPCFKRSLLDLLLRFQAQALYFMAGNYSHPNAQTCDVNKWRSNVSLQLGCPYLCYTPWRY